jgi:hypothetical protein
MNPIDLIVTVCAVLSPATCQETHLVFSGSASLQQCVMGAQPYIAQWVGEHPKWNAVRWRCEYPHSHDKADARGATSAGRWRFEAAARLPVAVLQVFVGD